MLLTLPANEEIEPFGQLQLALPLQVAPTGISEGQMMRGLALNTQMPLVHIAMTFRTQADQVVGHGLTVFGVELDVVDFQEEVVGAAGGLTAIAIAADQLGALGGRGHPRLGIIA